MPKKYFKIPVMLWYMLNEYLKKIHLMMQKEDLAEKNNHKPIKNKTTSFVKI